MKKNLFLGLLVIIAMCVANLVIAVTAINQRNAQVQREYQTQDYIKCIVLLRYDFPNLNEKSTKLEVEQALDSCASKGN